MPADPTADSATMASPMPEPAEPARRPDADERRDAEVEQLLHDDRRRGRAHHRRLDGDRDAVHRARVARAGRGAARRAGTRRGRRRSGRRSGWRGWDRPAAGRRARSRRARRGDGSGASGPPDAAAWRGGGGRDQDQYVTWSGDAGGGRGERRPGRPPRGRRAAARGTASQAAAMSAARRPAASSPTQRVLDRPDGRVERDALEHGARAPGLRPRQPQRDRRGRAAVRARATARPAATSASATSGGRVVVRRGARSGHGDGPGRGTGHAQVGRRERPGVDVGQAQVVAAPDR